MIYGILFVSELLGKVRGGMGRRDAEKVGSIFYGFYLVYEGCRPAGLARWAVGGNTASHVHLLRRIS
jgi:hypothetical protein